MPEYLYQYNFDTQNFIRKINNQIPDGDTVASLNATFCPILRIDVPATSEEDLDEYMAYEGFTRVPPAIEPTAQIAIGEIQLLIGTGPFSQRITSTPQKTNFWNNDRQSTAGIITADSSNNELTIDSLFNTNTGDRYDISLNTSVAVPNRDYCIIELIHNDDGAENIITQSQVYGQSQFGPQSLSLLGSILITSSINQSIYVNVRTIGGSETIQWYAGNMIAKRY